MRGMSRPLMLSGFIGLALACQESDAPTTSTREARTPDDGKVTTADGSFPSPVTLPSQPGGGPGGSLPSNPGPSNPPSNPSPGGPPTNPSPTNPPSFPSPGGGGLTPTPTSTPGGTPTSTPTGGGGGICPATVIITSSDVPFNTLPTGLGSGPEIDFSGFTDNCRILSVRTSFRVSAANLQTSTSSGQMAIALNFDQDGSTLTVRNFHLVDLGRTTDVPLLGTQMGTTCPSNLRFVETFPPFSTATPAYVGAFRPYGETAVPGGSQNFNRFDNLNPNGLWKLAFYLMNASVTVECWRVEFDLAGGGGGGLLTGKE